MNMLGTHNQYAPTLFASRPPGLRPHPPSPPTLSYSIFERNVSFSNTYFSIYDCKTNEKDSHINQLRHCRAVKKYSSTFRKTFVRCQDNEPIALLQTFLSEYQRFKEDAMNQISFPSVYRVLLFLDESVSQQSYGWIITDENNVTKTEEEGRALYHE